MANCAPNVDMTNIGELQFFLHANTIMTTTLLYTSFEWLWRGAVKYFTAFSSNYEIYGEYKRLYGVVKP